MSATKAGPVFVMGSDGEIEGHRPNGKKAARTLMATSPGSADIPENEGKWRSLRDGKRDIPEAERQRALKIVNRLIERDGLASRFTSQIDEWCVGDGATLTSRLKGARKRDAHEAALAECWGESQTDWPTYQHDIARTLAPVGEILAPIYPGEGAASAYAFIDPECIGSVVLNPHNARQTAGVLRVASPGERAVYYPNHRFMAWAEKYPREAKQTGLVPPSLEIGTPWSIPGGTAGDTKVVIGPLSAYCPWNRRVGATRGLSMFFAIADLLDALDQAVFQQIEGVAARNSWALHVIAKNATDAEAQAIAERVRKQAGKAGGHVGTNDNVEINVLTPALGSMDFEKHLLTLLRVLSAVTGWPVTWIGLGTDAGNAATTELAGPAMRMMRNHQAAIRAVMKELLDFGLLRLTKKYRLSEEEILDYEIQLPEIGGRDLVRDSAAASGLIVTIDAGREAGYWTPDKAGEMARQVMTELYGVEFGEEDVPDAEAVAAEKEARAAEGEGEGEPEDDDAKNDADDLAATRARGKKVRKAKA